jgi:uncharacterized membrane protein
MSLRRILTALVVVLAVGLPVAGVAQPAAQASSSVTSVARKASLEHAAVKGLTLKALTIITSAGILYGGTGDVAMTGWLTGLFAVSSYSLYVANDYLWDHYSPPVLSRRSDGSFDTGASLWRNTLKFLTFKASVVTVSWSMIYAFTGSLASTVTLGSMNSLALPVVFYINNVGWDWYDWHSGSGQAVPRAAARPAH